MRIHKRLSRVRLAAAPVVALVLLVTAGALWKSSPSSTPRAARALAIPRGVAFRERVPVLKAILETPPTASMTTALEDRRDRRAQRTMVLHRHVDAGRPLRVLVIGDSVGATFARGVELWARAHGHVQVRNEARQWCALGRGLPIGQGLSAHPPSAGCAGWGTRWSNAIRSFDPDVVFVFFSIWEVSPRLLPESGAWLEPGDPRLDTWQLSEYQAAADVLSARGASLVWFTIPCGTEPIVRDSPLWHVNRQTIPQLAVSRPSVHVVDLDHELCRNGPTDAYAGVPNARPDATHFSDAGAFAVARWVMPIVLGDAPNPATIGERDDGSDVAGVVIRRAS